MISLPSFFPPGEEEDEDESSLLSQKLDKTAQLIGRLAIAVAILALISMTVRYAIVEGEIGTP
jgi:hypothetical protein